MSSTPVTKASSADKFAKRFSILPVPSSLFNSDLSTHSEMIITYLQEAKMLAIQGRIIDGRELLEDLIMMGQLGDVSHSSEYWTFRSNYELLAGDLKASFTAVVLGKDAGATPTELLSMQASHLQKKIQALRTKKHGGNTAAPPRTPGPGVLPPRTPGPSKYATPGPVAPSTPYTLPSKFAASPRLIGTPASLITRRERDAAIAAMQSPTDKRQTTQREGSKTPSPTKEPSTKKTTSFVTPEKKTKTKKTPSPQTRAESKQRTASQTEVEKLQARLEHMAVAFKEVDPAMGSTVIYRREGTKGVITPVRASLRVLKKKGVTVVGKEFVEIANVDDLPKLIAGGGEVKPNPAVSRRCTLGKVSVPELPSTPTTSIDN